ncbi:MAG: response regulator transcription factor [Flavobacteriia bacterium]|nr:response regulator transcription factor [Flavobacteriia bacterium]OJX39004.1 MAG: DNA-binding response regulator [Flavobacteriia bacterium 40-80]
MQILIAEDDKRISDFLVAGLEQQGYTIILCRSAEEVLESYLSTPVDLFIIDVMLPKIDGIQLVQTLRYKKIFTPVLMLSALNSVNDKVNALDSGADDYLTKPFHFDELSSRIKALTRRNSIQDTQNTSTILNFGRLTIDMQQYRTFLDGQIIELSPKELKLLLYLVENKNKAVTRIQLLNAVWGINFNNQTNVVDVYISYLRNKIEKEDLKFIFTVKGIGYVFRF